MRRATGIMLGLLLALGASSAQASEAVLRALDKVTGRTEVVHVPLETVTAFGSFDMVLRHCHKNPPEEPADNAAFLEIYDRLNDETRAVVFSGWMFSSSPALSSVEHPVYDVWLLDCNVSAASNGSESP